MAMPEIRDFKDIFQGEIAQNGNWIVANISGSIAWPVEVQKIRFREVDLFVMPVTKMNYPGIAVRLEPPMARLDIERLILSFLSILSWLERRGILVKYWGGGNLPRMVGREDRHGIIRDQFDFPYFPEPTDAQGRLALGLYREGQSLNHGAYQFLSFYKVLEVKLGQRKRDIVAWINNNVNHIEDHKAKTILAELQAGVPDVGTYLYGSGRCAVAHASAAPLVNPDDPTDERRLAYELPVMTALAEVMIERELGIESSHTVWRKHLYELSGFKLLLGDELIKSVLAGQLSVREISLPTLDVRLRGKPLYVPFNDMAPVEATADQATMSILLRSQNNYLHMAIHLNFRDERLMFDPTKDIGVDDDGSLESAETAIEFWHFMHDFWANGRLEIYDAESLQLLSRKDAFMPVNVDLGRTLTALAAEAEKWRQAAQERRVATS